MNVFLKKVRIKTIFSIFEPIIVEPLELEYLKTVCDSLGLNSYIIDEIFYNENAFVRVNPDVIVLTGYNVAENQILKEAKEYKLKYPNVKIIVGGVHIQLNSNSFHNEYIDYIIHSQSLRTFEYVLRKIIGDDIEADGFDYRIDDRWKSGEKIVVSKIENIIANREFFNGIKDKTRYLDKKRLALIKGSIGCPYRCSFCYCRELNGGKYIKADYKKMLEEMATISTDYYWIVDDVLFTTRDDATDFIKEFNKLKLDKKYIAYLRADFILKNADIIPQLKKSGLDEIIIGFEAVTKEELASYNKGTEVLDYPKVISILKENKIDFTALFMVNPNYKVKDFVKLSKFIKVNKIEIFTLSIFTPIKGTKDYEDEKHNLIRKDPKYFDFLHLVTKSKLPKPIFYIFFYGIHLRLFKSRRIWRFLLK